MSERLRNLALVVAVASGGSAAAVAVYDAVSEQLTPQNKLVTQGGDVFPSPTGGVIIKFPDSTQAPDLSDAQLERRLERELDIKLLDRSEYLKSIGRKRVRLSNVDWNEARLDDLEQALLHLPARFHDQNPDGKDLSIVLEPEKFINGVCICLPNLAESDGSIHINRGVFDTSPRVLHILAHELTHDLQPWKTDNSGSKKFKDYTSPWVSRRDDILGPAKATAQRILDRILTLHPDVWTVDTLNLWEKDNLTDEEKRLFFASRLLYGIGFSYGIWDKLDYDTEFFAVMAETYTEGPEEFFADYGDYMTQDQVEEFYAFTKKIFKGYEYKDGKLVKAPTGDNS